jgi:hypothetical protein
VIRTIDMTPALGTAAMEPVLAWLHDHGLDPDRIGLTVQVEDDGTVVLEQRRLDADGSPAVTIRSDGEWDLDVERLAVTPRYPFPTP